MGRIDDVCEKIVDKGAFGALLEVANKQVGSGESTSLKATQALSVRTISYLAVNGPCARRARRRVASSVRPTDNPPSCLRCRGGCACALDCGGADRNQTRFLEDRQGNLRALTELLFVADNEDVRKYAAKTLAYLSLRNDKLKAGLLSGKGVQALIEALQGGSSAETLSHVACTIANLATNSTDRAAPHNRSTVAPNCPSGSRGPARARARTHAHTQTKARSCWCRTPASSPHCAHSWRTRPSAPTSCATWREAWPTLRSTVSAMRIRAGAR